MMIMMEERKVTDKTIKLYARLLDDFEFLLAGSEEDRLEVYHLRHRVYCQEIGYVPPSDIPPELEVDIHDHQALHCLVRHRRTGIAAGCFRLLLPVSTAQGAGFRLPLQEYAEPSLVHETLHPDRFSSHLICEISRFATAREFRHRPVRFETLSSDMEDHFTRSERELFPILTGALFLATHALVELTGRRHIFAMMQTRLPRLLARYGFRFCQIGTAIELHGTRHAYYIDNAVAEAEMVNTVRPAYQGIKERLRPQLTEAVMETSSISTHFSRLVPAPS